MSSDAGKLSCTRRYINPLGYGEESDDSMLVLLNRNSPSFIAGLKQYHRKLSTNHNQTFPKLGFKHKNLCPVDKDLKTASTQHYFDFRATQLKFRYLLRGKPFNLVSNFPFAPRVTLATGSKSAQVQLWLTRRVK